MEYGMEYLEIAVRLGISITLVKNIEKKALAKMAVQLGDEGALERLPVWLQKAGDCFGEVRHGCSKCGKTGHNARSCGRPARR